jgi:hypothetical protein
MIFASAMLRCRYVWLITIVFISAFVSQPLWINRSASQSSTSG